MKNLALAIDCNAINSAFDKSVLFLKDVPYTLYGLNFFNYKYKIIYEELN